MEEYDLLFESQGGKCLICGDSESRLGHRLAVDHDHKTGIIRGLLCKACNVALGNLKDDAELCERAAAYLKAKDAEGNR